MSWEKVHQYAVSFKPDAKEANLYLYLGEKTERYNMTWKERKMHSNKGTVINREIKLKVPFENITTIVDLLRNEKGLSYHTESGFLWSSRQDVGVGETTSEGQDRTFDSNGKLES